MNHRRNICTNEGMSYTLPFSVRASRKTVPISRSNGISLLAKVELLDFPTYQNRQTDINSTLSRIYVANTRGERKLRGSVGQATLGSLNPKPVATDGARTERHL